MDDGVGLDYQSNFFYARMKAVIADMSLSIKVDVESNSFASGLFISRLVLVNSGMQCPDGMMTGLSVECLSSNAFAINDFGAPLSGSMDKKIALSPMDMSSNPTPFIVVFIVLGALPLLWKFVVSVRSRKVQMTGTQAALLEELRP